MLIDTDVIIFYMRGNEKAKTLIAGNIGFHILVVTYTELVQGVRNKKELLSLRKVLRAWKTNIYFHLD